MEKWKAEVIKDFFQIIKNILTVVLVTIILKLIHRTIGQASWE